MVVARVQKEAAPSAALTWEEYVRGDAKARTPSSFILRALVERAEAARESLIAVARRIAELQVRRAPMKAFRDVALG